MSYYRVLGLQKEPFSTSPDPSLFYLSKEHRAALYRLMTSVMLRRGLSLILGDVGTGKTTLSRRFVQLIGSEPKVTIQMILNPLFRDEEEFLKEVCLRFGIPLGARTEEAAFYYSEIENFLFRKGVAEGRTIVLLIDEAQKLSESSLEALRGLLNYETNDYKILQVVLVSQAELVPRLLKMKNFWDRISLKHRLPFLEFHEMQQMIAYRLNCVGYDSPAPLFDHEALEAIYRVTRGSPRQVTQLCHDCLEHAVMHEKRCVDGRLVEHLVARENNFLFITDLKEREPHGLGAFSERADARRAVI